MDAGTRFIDGTWFEEDGTRARFGCAAEGREANAGARIDGVGAARLRRIRRAVPARDRRRVHMAIGGQGRDASGHAHRSRRAPRGRRHQERLRARARPPRGEGGLRVLRQPQARPAERRGDGGGAEREDRLLRCDHARQRLPHRSAHGSRGGGGGAPPRPRDGAHRRRAGVGRPGPLSGPGVAPRARLRNGCS